MTDDGAEARSPLALLASNARFTALSLVLLVPAIAFGALSVARGSDAARLYGGAAGIGELAVVMALAAAATAIPAGAVCDAVNPRVVFVATALVGGSTNLVVGVASLFGHLPFGLYVALAAVDGSMAAMNATALIPMQTALVAPRDTGAAQIVSTLRLSVGVLLGTLIAGVVANSTAVSLVGGLVVATFSVLAWVIARPGRHIGGERTAPRPSAPPTRTRDLVALLRRYPSLSYTVVVLLVLHLVIPTQLVGVVLADNDMLPVGYKVLMAGILAAIIARAVLIVTGLRLPAQRTLVASFGLYTAVAAFAALLLYRDVLLTNLPLTLVLVFLATFGSSLAVEFTAALVQQACPDPIRGRVTGLITSARGVMTAAGAFLATSIQVIADEPELLAVLSILAIVVLVSTRGFARMPQGA